ncbi:MAG: inorganic diphosphatase [Ardenticatenaceae bacterium]|nr:inorganic diphosphatase [Ardenticatenaceae bacterium]
MNEDAKKNSALQGTFENSQYIGQKVSIQIDRPLGSKHPVHEFEYPINYGFIPHTMAEDGEELDVYVLGVAEAIESFTGTVIAMIHRVNDNEDKLIVAPDGQMFNNEQIRKLTMFQEQYFKSVILRFPLDK